MRVSILQTLNLAPCKQVRVNEAWLLIPPNPGLKMIKTGSSGDAAPCRMTGLTLHSHFRGNEI